ncbi:hypothetical protein GALMADRAFT_208102 [Galerina marginata CBS 339.88]|uniref:Uncharacterized protein n=1 Tax=Galerina marginata (strain CBS 339.88) TaxID=685588 RepID=A0A067T988_GALM3|nr:hypothetical protein GALMADRAFT_208102 [Galerina marginata CBS 339.88]
MLLALASLFSALCAQLVSFDTFVSSSKKRQARRLDDAAAFIRVEELALFAFQHLEAVMQHYPNEGLFSCEESGSIPAWYWKDSEAVAPGVYQEQQSAVVQAALQQGYGIESKKGPTSELVPFRYKFVVPFVPLMLQYH